MNRLSAKWRVTLVAGDQEEQRARPFRLRRAVVEDFDGERYVHVQANAARKGIEDAAATVTFELEPLR